MTTNTNMTRLQSCTKLLFVTSKHFNIAQQYTDV